MQLDLNQTAELARIHLLGDVALYEPIWEQLNNLGLIEIEKTYQGWKATLTEKGINSLQNKPLNAIKLDAGHDPNGNGRRVYVVLSDNCVIDAVDEGSTGLISLTRIYPNIQVVYEGNCSVKEYRRLLKQKK